jgi:ATP-binding cassette subfamily B protein
MNKLKETIATLLLAARYSFSFCWKHAKSETIGRIIVSALATVLMYLTIQSTGLIINKVHDSMEVSTGGIHTPTEFVQSGLFAPVMLLLFVLLFGVVLGRFAWYYKGKWNHALRFANLGELNDHRAKLDVARFKSKEYDDLQKRIQELPTSWQTRIWYSDEMFNLFTTVVSFVLFGASLLWYAPMYALVLTIFALPMVIVEFRLVAMWWNLFQELVPHHKRRAILEKPYHTPHAFVQALMFNQMPPLRKEIEDNTDHVRKCYNEIRLITLRKEMLMRLLAVGSLCGVIVHAVWSTVAYVGEIGTLTIVLAAARTFQGNLEAIVSLAAEQWNGAKGVILIEKDFLGLKPVLKTESPTVPKPGIAPLIRFDKVCFAYPDTDTLVLKDVSFEIKPGTKTAIVGKSGNGKSTIQSLLMRHYDPSSGSIYADETNLLNIEPAAWNNIATALTQEYTVLERLVSEEIASSRLEENVDIEAVAASCRFANFNEVIESDPKGYDSQIGVEFGGRDFSGGEKQRLALARVHYRGTPVLILDEPDAKLDPESAQKVMDRIFALDGITVILITHHVSRAERCDNVVVMGKGEIAEQGTHQELMASGGVYASMYKKDRHRLGTDS